MSSDVGDGVILMAPWTWGGTSFSAMTSPMKTRVVEKVDLTSSKVRVSSRMSSLPSYSQRPLESANGIPSVEPSSLAVGGQLHERLRGVRVLALLEFVLAQVEKWIPHDASVMTDERRSSSGASLALSAA